MPRPKFVIPRKGWPKDLRDRLDSHQLTSAQRARLRHALGRWFKLSSDLNADARDASRESWLERTEGLPKNLRNDIRQALAIAFPDMAISLYSEDAERAERTDERTQLAETIKRNLARFPQDWSVNARAQLDLAASGLGDGILVQAWAASTIKRRLEATAVHFDYCRTQGFEVDVSPATVRAKLKQDQARVEAGDRRLGGVSADLEAITGLAQALWPERSWAWLRTARDRLKKLASYHGSRNAARAVDAAELRAAGQQLLDLADGAHVAARNRRDFVKAHTKARTAMSMILLSEAPIRISSCAGLELETGLLSDLAGLYLSATDTKEGDEDRRVFSGTLVDAMTRYIQTHRAVIAAKGETRLFVGERGGPIKPDQLSKCLGDFSKPVFGVRVTPHAIRHSVANFIVATAPEEAALASTILNHRGDATTPIYTQRADQIAASRRLRVATEDFAAELAVDTSPTRRRQKKTLGRRRPRPIERRASAAKKARRV